MKAYNSIDEYFKDFSGEQLEKLEAMQRIIIECVPEARPCISYNMPAFQWNGPLAYFAVYKKHIGFYPTPGPIEAFAEDLVDYKTSKGAVQFPLNQPLPEQLICNMLLYRKQQLESSKKNKK
jgi:uncharacterized protein YdhG (YjbR/CyaY superfamily)